MTQGGQIAGYLTDEQLIETFGKRHFSKSALICPISAPGSNFNPRNIPYIPVVNPLQANRLLPLKVRDLRLELEQKLPFFKGIASMGDG